MADAAPKGGGDDWRQKVMRKKKEKKKKKAPSAASKYTRGAPMATKKIEDKKLRGKMGRQEYMNREAASRAAKSEVLQTHEEGSLEAEGMERTYKFTQEQLKPHLDQRSARKTFELDLEYGPYKMRYSKNGKWLLVGGAKGHIGLMDWARGDLKTELHVQEAVRDVCMLHNESLFAVAQKKYTYIYDTQGTEIHCLRDHRDVTRLDFLPYHYLMVSVGNAGYLKYQDVSTGALVTEMRTGKGRCDCMRQNPRNAVVHLGHGDGTVSLWAPSQTAPLVQFLAHRGPVRSVAIDDQGIYMATSGMDGYVKMWDVRTHKMLHAYTTVRPADGLDISGRGMLAVGQGSHVQVWKDALSHKQNSPYMTHELPRKTVSDLRFCPLEDVLGVSHSLGFVSCIIPGAGRANYDSFEANPYETKKQRRETEIKGLLEKLQPDMIALDPDFIGTVADHSKSIDENRRKRRAETAHGADEALEEGVRDGDSTEATDATKPKDKRRTRGRSTAAKRFKRKSVNVISEAKVRYAEKQEKIEKDKAKAVEIERRGTGPADALSRFK